VEKHPWWRQGERRAGRLGPAAGRREAGRAEINEVAAAAPARSAAADLSFDSIFGSDDRGQAQDSGRDDLSLDALIGGGLGYDAGESTPRYDHLGSLPPLWVTVR
jgi:hypothetical protein